MASKNEEVLSGLMTAMEAELTGHNFYKNAANSVSDPQGKETLLEMADEEMNHFNYLRHQYTSVLEQGDYDFAKKLVRKSSAEGQNPIFSQAIKDRIKESHYEVSVLTIGMKLEMDAIEYYRSCAEKAKTQEAKDLYEELAKWEEGHYHAFKRELEALKEDYWQANSFVPM
jgi:rubrerythrin